MKKKVLTLDDLYSFFEQRNQTTVFPSFQVSPDCDLTLETDSTITFSGVAQRDYCQTGSPLYYIVMTEDDVEE